MLYQVTYRGTRTGCRHSRSGDKSAVFTLLVTSESPPEKVEECLRRLAESSGEQAWPDQEGSEYDILDVSPVFNLDDHDFTNRWDHPFQTPE